MPRLRRFSIRRCGGLVNDVMRMALATGVLSALLIATLPSAAAAPATDDQGYVSSTARCAAPNSVVVFGSTDSSRIAICKTPNGEYEYRGVRVSDGAKLIVPAKASGDGAFVADNGVIGYTVTAKSLVVSEGNRVIREEPMVDFHGTQAPGPQPEAPKPNPQPEAPKPTPTPTTPLPPPLPAERG